MSIESDLARMKRSMAEEQAGTPVTVVLVEPTPERPAGTRIEREMPYGRVIEISYGGERIEYPPGSFKLISGKNPVDMV